MHFYRSTLLAVCLGASAIGSLPNINAQSFDYPENSKSIFSRWAGRHQQATSGSPSAQLPTPRKSLQPFSFKRQKPSQGNAASQNLVERIQAFDSQKTFSLAQPPTSELPQNQQFQQTSWANPLARRQAERSILEVVDQPARVAPVRNQVPVLPQTQAAPNYRTAAHPISINEANPRKSGLTKTQAMLQRQQRQVQDLKPNAGNYQNATTAQPQTTNGSFEQQFNKAYELIGNDKQRTAPSANAASPSPVRVAQRNSINAVRAAHSATQPAVSSADSGFDLIPEDGAAADALDLPNLDSLNEVEPGVFDRLKLDGSAPNEDSSFSPPNNMIFEAPATEAPQQMPQREPDILPSLDRATPPVPIETAPIVAPEAPTSSPEDIDKKIQEFAPVETSKTWSPPIVPKTPTQPITPEPPSALDQPITTVETIQEDVAWWKSRVGQPLHVQNTAQPVDTNGLVLEALRSSPLIKAVSKTPLIRELQVVEADAEFDTVTFLDSQFQDRVDPVGNSLTTGGEPFLEDNIWSAEAGIRKRLRNGASYDLSQTLGFQNSNSTFFTPQDQGTATLALNVTQPLLRGRGRYVNQSQILIAQSSGAAAWDTFKTELQEELEGVVTAYWDLYLQRSIYLQKKRNVERGQVMLDRLLGRQGLDSLPAQIARAKSAVLTRRTELANAFRDVRNAETEIRRRVADKNWQASQSVELLPVEIPFAQSSGLELEQVVYTALENRPEIAESIRRIRIAGVQRDVSANELLPELNLLLGSYVSSLRGDTGILNAFQDQFGQVTPGYSIGLEYELPYRNRAARSRLQQRNLQFRRLQNELENVIQNVIAEAQVATRQVSSAFETLRAAREAVVASRADLVQNQKRWESFALVEGDIADGQSPTIVLDQLLDSQERLSQAESVYVEAEQGLKIAEVALQRTMGTLLMHQQVDFSRSVKCDVPSIHINKANTSPVAQFESAQPQFNQPQFSQPQFVQQQPTQPRVATLNNIVPTPTDEEVARLMQRPTFTEPSSRIPVTNTPSRRLAQPASYQSNGSAPRFGFGYQAK